MPSETSFNPTLQADIPGYELLEEVGRGGMGVVYRVRDQRLDRDVAIKLLAEKSKASSAAAARFVVEAKITGQLQHPGIPAVHELGTLPDGRPFLAMKLVMGRTLQQLLDENSSLTVGAQTHEKDGLSRDGKGAVTSDRGRFLAIFEQICHAVGYAHAHRVIHRDLKPSNIMVGAFGEVQVMDWGLAKFLDTSPDREGGVLVELAVSADPNATTNFLANADTPPARESATRTGTVLGTPSFMAPEQAAGELELLNDRSDVFSLGAILCMILTGRSPYAGQDAQDVLVKASRGELQDALARVEACGAEPEVVALCKRCLSVKQADRPANGQAVAEAVASIRNQAEARARQAELDRAQALVREAEQRKRRRVWFGLAATCLVGLLGLALGVIVLLGLNRRLDTANSSLGAALENERAARNLADERKRLADDNFKEALDAVKAQVYDIDKELMNRAGTRDLREKLLKSATDRLKNLVDRASQRAAVDHTAFSAHLGLGDVYLHVDLKPSLACTEYEKAAAIARQLVEADPRDAAAQRTLAVTYSKLGDISLQTGSATAAVRYYTDALDIHKRLAAADPRFAEAQRDLYIALNKLGDIRLQSGDATAALQCYTEGLDVSQRLVAADPRDAQAQRELSIAYSKLGDVGLQMGDAPTAVKYYTDGLDLSKKLATADPRDAQAQRDLSVSYDKLGDVGLRTGDMTAAVRYYTDALDLRKELAAAAPRDALAQRDLSISYDKLGDVSLRTGDASAALKSYTENLYINKKLAATDAHDARAQRDLSISYDKLGNLSLLTGDTTAAVNYYTDALDIRKQLAAADSRDGSAQTDLFVSYWKLGKAEQGAGRYRQGVTWFEMALTVLRPLHVAGKLHGQFKNGVVIVEKDLASCELMAKLSSGLIHDPAWPLLWGWPRF